MERMRETETEGYKSSNYIILYFTFTGGETQ